MFEVHVIDSPPLRRDRPRWARRAIECDVRMRIDEAGHHSERFEHACRFGRGDVVPHGLDLPAADEDLPVPNHAIRDRVNRPRANDRHLLGGTGRGHP